MIAFFCLLFCVCAFIIFCKWFIEACNNGSEIEILAFFLNVLVCIGIFLTIQFIIEDIQKYNNTYTEVKFMSPVAIDITKYNNAKTELKKTENLIQNVVGKYKVQVEVKSLQGINIYSMPMSANTTSFQGLGDIERGSGEKLKNLEVLIEKQNQIANNIISLYNAQFKPEYYNNLQNLNALRYSWFSGWFVRWFGINEKDTIVVQNQNIYPL